MTTQPLPCVRFYRRLMTRNGKVEFVPEVFGCVEPAVAQQIESGGSGVELATAHEVEIDCSDCNICNF